MGLPTESFIWNKQISENEKFIFFPNGNTGLTAFYEIVFDRNEICSKLLSKLLSK